jgi:hypothetical protein
VVLSTHSILGEGIRGETSLRDTLRRLDLRMKSVTKFRGGRATRGVVGAPNRAHQSRRDHQGEEGIGGEGVREGGENKR